MFKLITALNFNVACIACKTIWVYYIQILPFCFCFFISYKKIFLFAFLLYKEAKNKRVRKDGAEKNDFLKSTRTSIITNILMDVHAR